jgi:hypothetical protein
MTRIGQRDILPTRVTNRLIKDIGVNKITTGTLTVAMNVGDGNVVIDGENKRIIINDGTNDRILIGYQENGF